VAAAVVAVAADVVDVLEDPDEPPDAAGVEELVEEVEDVVGVLLEELEAAPDPAEFTARISTLYAVSLVSPAIVRGEVVDAGLRTVHVPPLTRYS
jgi:phosphate uptake regulator